ncbi:MAG: hypothetical protein WB560_14500, partial [Desulfobaccales bacterium]
MDYRSSIGPLLKLPVEDRRERILPKDQKTHAWIFAEPSNYQIDQVVSRRSREAAVFPKVKYGFRYSVKIIT